MGALAIDGLRAGYGEHDIVDDLSLVVPEGSLTVLLGPNGSGKSTLLRTIARLHPARDGAVLLDGRDLARLGGRDLARVLSFLPQAPLVPSGVTVRELVGYGRYAHQGALGRVSAADRDAVTWALGVTGTDDMAERRVETLSGGERQRAWIAMALAQRTRLLLLDEPTTFLDIRYQVEVLRLLRGLVDEHGLTVVAVLHDLNQAAAYADRVVMLHAGRVAFDGPPQQVLTADAVQTVFGVDVDVACDAATGAVTVLPYRRPASAVR